MERGIRDEGFVRRALDTEGGDEGRWLANQSSFNFPDADELSPSVRAAMVTATGIYFRRGMVPESAIEEALNIKTCGDARKFIDKYTEQTINK
ncbi:TPA: hypothetical protein F3P23_13080 [Aeromonas hydrophila]|nr:hypothetical protein [Aeromonas hydrophila]